MMSVAQGYRRCHISLIPIPSPSVTKPPAAVVAELSLWMWLLPSLTFDADGHERLFSILFRLSIVALALSGVAVGPPRHRIP